MQPHSSSHSLCGVSDFMVFRSWFAHVPGLKVVMPATAYDAKGLLKATIRDDNPVLVVENKALYGRKGEVPEEEYVVALGKAET
jgi:pyruvate/2-oxoglutarate/acetoin dehydrogenase E1 component